MQCGISQQAQYHHRNDLQDLKYQEMKYMPPQHQNGHRLDYHNPWGIPCTDAWNNSGMPQLQDMRDMAMGGQHAIHWHSVPMVLHLTPSV
jgi:hypothetical protein